MSKTVLIAGTGTMARNIGLYFLRKSFRVYWASHNEDFLRALRKKIDKDSSRLQKLYPDTVTSDRTGFYIFGHDEIPAPDYIIESTIESLSGKQKIVSSLNNFLTNDHILFFSNSSSLLPSAIHPVCIGCHFYFPVEINETVELIFPPSLSATHRLKVLGVITDLGMVPIEETEKTAFAVNRLLLPLQAEAFRLLRAGYDPVTVNNATVSDLLPVGQLALMDRIGLDTVYASAITYLSRMNEKTAHSYLPLVTGLEELISQGKQGNRNRDGLLNGSPLPWKQKPPSDCTISLSHHFLLLLLNTAHEFIQSQHLSSSHINHIFTAIFQGSRTVSDIESPDTQTENSATLRNLFNETGISYFYPRL
jgi:3-hydroxyacyl-CoA dehydrogenase